MIERWCERDQRFFNEREWRLHRTLCKEHSTTALYLILNIPPSGGSCNLLLREADEAPDPYQFTRGEGQCMVFKLEEADYSNEFGDAVNDGRFLADFNAGYFNLEVR
jgi:hypothetical protein